MFSKSLEAFLSPCYTEQRKATATLYVRWHGPQRKVATVNDKSVRRFWSKVNKDGPTPAHCPELGPCWPWTGSTSGRGYGRFAIDGTLKDYAHRVAWELANGPVPKGPQVLHKCDNPPCCRPDHLFAGTLQDNLSDMVRKGRQRKGESKPNAKLTETTVLKARALRAAGWSYAALGRRFGVNHDTVRVACLRITWRHV